MTRAFIPPPVHHLVGHDLESIKQSIMDIGDCSERSNYSMYDFISHESADQLAKYILPIMRDANRYRKIRAKAMGIGTLEEFVAMNQVDHVNDSDNIDAVFDCLPNATDDRAVAAPVNQLVGQHES